MIEIVRAPPFATVQDRGFPVGRSWGLPRCGAMDPVLLGLANGLAGNPPDAAGLEWALGSGAIRADRTTRVAVLGVAHISIDEVPLDPPRLAFSMAAGATISIEPGTLQRYSYVAVAGGIALAPLLGSRSTYLPGGLGGWDGRRLHAGDRLEVGLPAGEASRAFEVQVPELREPATPDELVIRVVRGPQWDHFEPGERARLFGEVYQVDASSDRMGYRLAGPPIRPREEAGFPSEAACPGAIQIPDGGQPIVLMPDGPTVGGYPKLAVVIHADLRRLAQCPPGRCVRFREVSLEAARACYSEDR